MLKYMILCLILSNLGEFLNVAPFYLLLHFFFYSLKGSGVEKPKLWVVGIQFTFNFGLVTQYTPCVAVGLCGVKFYKHD